MAYCTVTNKLCKVLNIAGYKKSTKFLMDIGELTFKDNNENTHRHT